MTRARLLDLTRSMRRAGRMATGVDRVENAYLDHFLSRIEPVFGVVRTSLGYLLLDREGLQAFRDKRDGAVSWGGTSMLSRLTSRGDPDVKRVESDLRRLAVARARRGKLSEMLAAQMPDGFDYFNVGHSNLTFRVFESVKTAGGTIHVLVHDVIPLDHPEFQRPETVEPFRAKMRRVSEFADTVIYNSQDTRIRAEHYFGQWGQVPNGIVAHLGTIAPEPDPTDLPAGSPPNAPYFVVVGTIEPRKNHAFLLDIWEEMGADAPPLLICGSRGWNNDAVFARLDALPKGDPVKVVPNLSDAALAWLVQNSAGLLFPSVAEGFGLPPVEALSLGTRVLCNDLPVLHEILGRKPVYAQIPNRYLWINTIKSWAKSPPAVQKTERYSPPNWDDHFKTVLRLR